MSKQSEHNFDDFIRESLDNHEVEYDAQAWDGIENTLNKIDKAHKRKRVFQAAAVISAVIACSSLLFFIKDDPSALSGSANKNTIADKANARQQKTTHAEQEVVNAPKQQTSTPVDSKVARKNRNIKKADKKPTQQTTKENSTGEGDNNSSINAIDYKKNTPLDNTNSHPEALSETRLQKATSASPNANFSVNTTEGCEYSTFKFYSENEKVPVQYLWDFGDGTTAEHPSPTHRYAQPGNYEVSLTVISDIDGQKETYVLPEGVTVYSSPIADFDYQLPDETDINDKVAFTNNSFNDHSREWMFSTKKQAEIVTSDPELSLKSGLHNVSLIVTNNHGCKDTISKQVYVPEKSNPLLAPTAFSPNGDGRNDTWIPERIKSGNYRFKLVIMDQSGRQVFSTKDKNNAWDGRIAGSNRKATQGQTFAWVAVVYDQEGASHSYKGTITVLTP